MTSKFNDALSQFTAAIDESNYLFFALAIAPEETNSDSFVVGNTDFFRHPAVHELLITLYTIEQINPTAAIDVCQKMKLNLDKQLEERKKEVH